MSSKYWIVTQLSGDSTPGAEVPLAHGALHAAGLEEPGMESHRNANEGPDALRYCLDLSKT